MYLCYTIRLHLRISSVRCKEWGWVKWTPLYSSYINARPHTRLRYNRLAINWTCFLATIRLSQLSYSAWRLGHYGLNICTRESYTHELSTTCKGKMAHNHALCLYAIANKLISRQGYRSMTGQQPGLPTVHSTSFPHEQLTASKIWTRYPTI